MRTPKLKTVYSALLAAVVAMAAGPSWAVTVTSCSQSCTANCELTSNINCSGQSGITLSNGADLDLNGFSLTCTSSCPSAAVTMAGTDNIVKNLSGTESTISGHFATFVNCNGRSSSEVLGIRIESTVTGTPSVTGLLECHRASNNVIIDTIPSNGSTGIYTSGVANSDQTTDNYLEGWAQGISAGGTRPIEIKRNQIVVHDATSNEVGILIRTGTSGAMEVENNSFYDTMTTPADLLLQAFGVSVFFAQNYCDPGTLSCQICDLCSQPFAPFQ